ncbi:MAG TPA: glycosyltransferase family 39 protein, partial [Kineosporiaceae bacterium]|nr:glycosyltransferase family 39 protein [Kineosporiaceae bacterium]
MPDQHHAPTPLGRQPTAPGTTPTWALPAAATVRTRLVLAGLLLATLAGYLWNLDRNGWGNTFYAAAVQAGTQSWKAFFFGSFDAGNFITVDKPPVSLWVMELSGRVFGFSSWSMLAPQALLGVASVALLYASVRRVWGAHAGLLAAAALATTPVAALMFRFNNPDAALTFLLVLAAWTLTRALERGRLRWLLATGAVLGFAFLTKELQALLVLPGFALAYLLCGPARLATRIGQLLAAGGVLAVSGLWWPVLVDTLPATDRPYVGGSTANNVLQLALGYNGLGRITGEEGNSGPGGAGTGLSGGAHPDGALPGGGVPGGAPGGGGPGGPGGFGGSTGIGRMFNEQFGGMSAWLIPAAVIGLGAGIWLTRRAVRTDPRRASLILWGGWLLVTACLLSYAGGIIHSYYAVALAPGIAACAGMVLPTLWRRRERLWARLTLALTSAATAVTATVLLGRAGDWLPWLQAAVPLVGLLAAVGLLVVPRKRPGPGE